jgi:hypothetical protein
MLSDRALANFRRFIAANPNGPRHNPAGAFDSMPPSLSRRGGIPISAFERGGAFDEEATSTALSTIDEGQASALLEYLNGKLSDEDLEQLRGMLQSNTQTAIESQPTAFSGDARNRRIATDTILRREGRQLSRAAALFPELARIKLG